jgi:phosphatidylglycerol:prolipoprotein diacylglycerol transferase
VNRRRDDADVVPVLFTVGGHPVGTHGFFVGLGALVATVVFFIEARRRGPITEDLALIAAGTLVCGAVAARLSTAWQYADLTGDAPLNAWARGGRSILGGLAGAYVGAVLTKRLVGYRAHTGDLFAPAVALGMAIGRWGCFLTEEPGAATALPWGIHLSPDAAARIPRCPACESGQAMHPSFLYEIAFHAAMFVLLLWLRRRLRSNGGDLLKIYLLAYAVFRFAVEFVRGNDVWVAGLTRSQLFLIPATALLALYLARRSTLSRAPAMNAEAMA